MYSYHTINCKQYPPQCAILGDCILDTTFNKIRTFEEAINKGINPNNLQRIGFGSSEANEYILTKIRDNTINTDIAYLYWVDLVMGQTFNDVRISIENNRATIHGY